jgi:glycosyltransferase involved in cell wall biosynthesis
VAKGPPDYPKIVVVTPVKNEAWILDRFLRAASAWADAIVIADQQSSDGSREIARRHGKVRLIDNPSPGYDEGARQRLLLAAAREVPGPRVIFALDADEMLTANGLSADFLERVKRLPPRTAVHMCWANVLPGGDRVWLPGDPKVFAVVDDGREHAGQAIHSPRLPVSTDAPSVTVDDVLILHFQYFWWSRMKSKQRWYQCWEALNHPSKRPIQLFRQYHHMDAIPPAEVRPLPKSWLAGYAEGRLDVLPEIPDEPSRWDQEVLGWILEHGARRFARLDMWDVDWAQVARQTGVAADAAAVADPRTAFERRVHAWLRRTQSRATERPVRMRQRFLIPFGW